MQNIRPGKPNKWKKAITKIATRFKELNLKEMNFQCMKKENGGNHENVHLVEINKKFKFAKKTYF